MLRQDWQEMLARDGLAPVAAAPPVGEHDEPPCPACGSTAGLDDGACKDCGLQLG